jgi:recombination associated protein RdgC
MYFKNLHLFRFSPSVGVDLGRLGREAEAHRLRPCGDLEMATRGFVSPTSGDTAAPLTLEQSDFIMFAIGTEEKILPASVVTDAVAERVAKIEAEEKRTVGFRERKRIRDDTLTELLPRALKKRSRIRGFADTRDGWLVIDTSSRKQAENVMTRVREALGSFPAVPLAPESSPRLLLTDWLSDSEAHLPEMLSLGSACELRDPSTPQGARWKGRNTDLDSEEVREHLRNGMQAHQVAFTFDDRLALTLDAELVVRGFKFLDVALESINDSAPDGAAVADSQFALLSLEVRALLTRLAEWFELPRPEDASP